MSWIAELSAEAEAQLKRLPPKVRRQVGRAIDAMEVDPFQGDVKSLQGRQWVGRYRKRVGRYRIIFTVDRTRRHVMISAILLRSEKTYE